MHHHLNSQYHYYEPIVFSINISKIPATSDNSQYYRVNIVSDTSKPDIILLIHTGIG